MGRCGGWLLRPAGRQRVPRDRTEVAAAQLVPAAEGQQPLRPTATGSAGVKPLLPVTPVMGHCVTRPPAQAGLSTEGSRLCSCASCSATSSPSRDSHSLPSAAPTQAPKPKMFAPAGSSSLCFMQPGARVLAGMSTLQVQLQLLPTSTPQFLQSGGKMNMSLPAQVLGECHMYTLSQALSRSSPWIGLTEMKPGKTGGYHLLLQRGAF